MKSPKIERFQGADGQFRVRVRGGNGEKIVTSEAYASKGNATRAAKRLTALIPAAVLKLTTLLAVLLTLTGCLTTQPVAAIRQFDNQLAAKMGVSEAQMNYVRDLVGLPTGADPLAGYEVTERRVDATGHEIRDPITITRTLTRVQVVSFGDIKAAVAPPAPTNAVPADVLDALGKLPL
jgi:uncharacterized protein YegP (UPF0339 family)